MISTNLNNYDLVLRCKLKMTAKILNALHMEILGSEMIILIKK